METHSQDGQAVRERKPHVSENLIATLHCPINGATNLTAATDAFVSAAQRAGATISTNVGAASIEYAGGKAIAIITTDGQCIHATRGIILLHNGGIQPLLDSELEKQPIRHLIRSCQFLPSCQSPSRQPGHDFRRTSRHLG